MENKIHPKRLISQILAFHLLMSALYFFVLGTYHPLMGILGRFTALWVQVPLAFLFALLLYIIPGFLFVIAKQNHSDLKQNLRIALFFLLTVLTIAFLIIYGLNQFWDARGLWALYAMLNPAFGSLIYQLSPDKVSLFWILSSLAPVIGLYIGIRLALKREDI